MPNDNSFTIYADLMTHVAPSECIPWTVVLIAECLAIVTVNIVTIIVFLKQRKLQRRGTYLVISVSYVSYVSIFIKARRSPRHLQNHVADRRERKLTVTLLIVTLVSLQTWLPNAVFFLVVVIDNETFWGLSYLSHFHMSVAFIALSLCNSLVNPIVYTMRIREFRVAIWNLFCGTSVKRSNVIVLRPRIHSL